MAMSKRQQAYYEAQQVFPGGYPAGENLTWYAFLPVVGLIIGSVLLFLISQRAWAAYDGTAVISEKAPAQVIVAGGKKTGLDNGGGIARLFTPEVLYWKEKLLIWSKRWGVDPNLAATVMQIESCGNPQAVSPAGAAGLFQVMPDHFGMQEDPFKPGVNARRGLGYLAASVQAGAGDIRRIFAGYNGGIHGATRPENMWPEETRRYVYWGTGIYEDAAANLAHSSRLDEWLAHGGAGLCRQAANVLKATR